MKNIIEKAWLDSYNYIDYMALVSKLIKEGKSTGHTQSEALLHYSQLNEARVKRLDKTIEIDVTVAQALKEIEQPLDWLVIAEGWCGDAAQILPILNKMALQNENINLRIVLRDNHIDLMDLFLTNGSRSIPKLIILDGTTKETIADWGPRPEPARKLIADYKVKHGIVDEPVKIELQKWYLQDKGLTTQQEILDIVNEYLFKPQDTFTQRISSSIE
ncbi:Thioredoxin family protein [Flavobacterium sp. 9AF]|uniref:thioredoxin family protein n=1 Tax=Flavobacterium sp. 9AF TaxID=2653142 RepID=UPI0012F43A93|nr:thioredoxin family protein [Flavobacterium sp. 9AF]VXB26559.1 Thioredoxin family protein [Flavobacterium sp. 9AF]